MRRNLSTARTRRFSVSVGGRSSLAKMLLTCFSTALWLTCRASTMAWLLRPSAIIRSTWSSRGVSRSIGSSRWRTCSCATSFAAVPSRLPVLRGKAIGYTLAVLALCVPATFAAFLVGQSILSSGHLDTTLGQPGVARAVLGGALYLAAVGLLGLGLGALLRGTAAAVGALFGLLFAPQILVGLLPSTWSDHLYGYLPAPAGIAVSNLRPAPTSLAPWTGFGVFCLYTAIVLALAAWRLRRRDT
jgi:ABC-2 type transport system permease protein